MKIDKKIVFDKIQQYLNHEITIESLVDWAEYVMMSAEFDEHDFDLIHKIVSRIGLADVRAFGLTWEECENYINELGYRVKLEFEFA
jgi:hypothetical protein